MRFNVLIIGCGNIAGGYDIGIDKAELPCSHAGAYSRNKGFEIIGCVEPDENKRHNFMDYWSIPNGYSTLEEVLDSNLPIDVISICSPTKLHFSHAMLAIKLTPKLIFCEKPVTTTAKETKLLIDACNKKRIVLAVNYTRRWDPKIETLKQQLDSEYYGKLRSIVVYYNKGILNNGSHFIDLLHYLLGDIRVVATLQNTIDYSPDDPTIPALLQSKKNVPINLVTSDARDYELCEMQIICSKGMLTMHEGGLYWTHKIVENSKRFMGYKILGPYTEQQPGECQHAMTRAVENIYKALTEDTKIASDGVSAYQAQLICEQIIKKDKTYILFRRSK